MEDRRGGQEPVALGLAGGGEARHPAQARAGRPVHDPGRVGEVCRARLGDLDQALQMTGVPQVVVSEVGDPRSAGCPNARVVRRRLAAGVALERDPARSPVAPVGHDPLGVVGATRRRRQAPLSRLSSARAPSRGSAAGPPTSCRSRSPRSPAAPSTPPLLAPAGGEAERDPVVLDRQAVLVGIGVVVRHAREVDERRVVVPGRSRPRARHLPARSTGPGCAR